MFCTKCGNKTEPSASFCNKCGNKLDTAQNKPAKMNFPSFNKRYLLFGGIGILVIVFIIAILNINSPSRDSNTAASGIISRREAASPETEVRQAIDNFNRDLNNSLDLSVYIDGKDLDLSPVRKYFDTISAYSFIQQLEYDFNEQFALFKYLDFGAGLASDILSGVIGAIPIFGDALSGLTQREIENDPLLDRKNWENMASITFTPEQIDIDGDTAIITVTVNMKTDTRGFRNSNILRLLSIDFGNEIMDESITISASMKKQPSGEWLFTDFEDFY
jgi:hypothetical protein